MSPEAAQFQIMLNAVTTQRNEAQNQVAQLQTENTMLKMRLHELQVENEETEEEDKVKD